MEDDDLYLRLQSVFGEPARLPSEIGRYRALAHQRVKDLDVTPVFMNNRRYLDYASSHQQQAMGEDGLSSVRYHVVGDVVVSPLGYTKVTIGFDLPWMPVTPNDLPPVDSSDDAGGTKSTDPLG